MAEKNSLVVLKKFEEKIIKNTHQPRMVRSALTWPDTPENRTELKIILKQFKSFKKS